MTTIPTTINPDRLAYDAMQEAIAHIQKQQLHWETIDEFLQDSDPLP